MKSIVVLFAPSISLHLFDSVFNGKSSYEKSLRWAQNVPGSTGVFIFTDKNTASKCAAVNSKNGIENSKIIEKDSWTVYDLLCSMHEVCQNANAQTIVYAWADCPFLNISLTKEIIETHGKYRAEYTYADGYPYGFSPEAVDCGAASIIAELSVKEGLPNNTGHNSVTRDSIFSAMKGDINAFEIETVLSQTDWRMYRFNFHCGSKECLIACKKLSEIADGEESPEVLSRKASECAGILRTVPGFYNIQIEPKYRSRCIYSPYPAELEKTKKHFSEMTFEQFAPLVKQIASFSENAVISLSLWGEALYHPQLLQFVAEVLKYPGLSVFIETTGEMFGKTAGTALTETFAAKIADAAKNAVPRTNGYEKVMWVVLLDAVTKEKYEEIHFTDGFTTALKAVTVLEKYFPLAVYPQFTRMNQNEDQLEAFYRFWSAKTSLSGGKLIIQKYNSYGGLLPENKPCDLTPVERYPDWHLRRDMVILCNGDVPLYKESMLENCIGNVFTESLETIWHKSNNLMEDQIHKKYDEISGKCDEYYTFNF